jgi:hypothetical protein
MNLFRKKKAGTAATGWAVRLSGWVDRLHTRMAAYLNSRTAGLSTRGKWVFFGAVCLLFGGFSLYLLIKAFM